MKNSCRTWPARFLGFVILLLVGTLVPAGAAQHAEGCGRFALVLLDATGSFTKDLPAAILEAKRVLLGLDAGDCFLARTIRDQSYRASNDVVPLLRLPLARRTIDAAHRRQLLVAKREAGAKLDGVANQTPARATDYWQALHSASLAFRTVEAREREMHVMGDLEDNRRLKPAAPRLRLDGARVRLVVARGDRDTAETFERRLEAWRRVFREAGASDVTFAELSRTRLAASADGRVR